MVADRCGGDVFTVDVDVADAATVVTLGGELDLAGGDRFSEALEVAVGAGDRDVVIECGELTYIDSTGISLICVARPRLQDGRILTLRRAQPSTRRAFELCGLSDWLSE